MKNLRLMIYDDTCRTSRLGLGLTHSWIAGGILYKTLGRFQHTYAAQSWEEALDWIADIEKDRPICEIQFWGHGKWGQAQIDGQPLNAHATVPGHHLYKRLHRVKERMSGPDALWWFRTCETFGCEAGHDFAQRWSNFFGCTSAGHTYIIGPWQSGLHTLKPGDTPTWSLEEGLKRGTPAKPQEAHWSTASTPRTISCLHSRIPQTW